MPRSTTCPFAMPPEIDPNARFQERTLLGRVDRSSIRLIVDQGLLAFDGLFAGSLAGMEIVVLADAVEGDVEGTAGQDRDIVCPRIRANSS